jgi:hypothetical protein
MQPSSRHWPQRVRAARELADRRSASAPAALPAQSSLAGEGALAAVFEPLHRRIERLLAAQL